MAVRNPNPAPHRSAREDASLGRGLRQAASFAPLLQRSPPAAPASKTAAPMRRSESNLLPSFCRLGRLLLRKPGGFPNGPKNLNLETRP
eukprot:3742965-Pyramimonas_sp.AAC.1